MPIGELTPHFFSIYILKDNIFEIVYKFKLKYIYIAFLTTNMSQHYSRKKPF
uniref:Uncharacterized protein n=1 Tax=Lepeophtheirus salmonis TaxID=72036 RepID=A0A0K2SZN5_LEPSM